MDNTRKENTQGTSRARGGEPSTEAKRITRKRGCKERPQGKKGKLSASTDPTRVTCIIQDLVALHEGGYRIRRMERGSLVNGKLLCDTIHDNVTQARA